MSDNNINEGNLTRKRSHSSNSSLLSNNDDDHQRKRIKPSTINPSQTDDIEIIILSSSDNSDNEDQLS
jgi:hypothetical protein